MHKLTYAVITMAALTASANPAAANEQELEALKKRIEELENKLSKLEPKPVAAAPAAAVTNPKADNSFNPAISLVLNGQYGKYSAKASDFAGFGIGEEGERPGKGFAVGESELSISSNIDDKFFGKLTAALVNEDGGTELELEEAFFQTTPGLGLPDGLTLKAGRALWDIGYLNSKHAHTDDFADRPLPYRAFLNNHFNDDGVQFSYVLPTDLYAEVGGGLFRGDDFPFGASNSKYFGAWSSYAKIGGDIADNHTWQLGVSTLNGESDERLTNEDNLSFTGNSNLYIADAKYTYAPTGNSKDQLITLQGEYFLRDENGQYDDILAGTGAVDFDGRSSGWYAQTTYKFAPEWRIGARYSQLYTPDLPAGLVASSLDANGHDPRSASIMGDWTNSEFSRIRLQYNREELSAGNDDNQFILQYVMSLGAHGAHQY